MGSSMSCVPQHNFRFSSKSFIRRNSSRLFRKKYPQEGQEKSNSIINILCTVTPRKEMSPKDLQTIENIKWDPPFPYDPASGWKKSSINVKNYGRMIHSSKVRFRFLHCQDVHNCYLDLFQTHLHFVSNNTTGLTYQGTLPLKELTICKVQNRNSFGDLQEFAFQINGVSLNPIIVYCSTEEEMNNWFGLLKEQIEANGGTAITPETYTRIKVQYSEESKVEKEELRNSISKEPIYEWEGSQRESLGPITYVTKVKLQHMPCQEQYDRLLVLYPNYLIILSEESDGLFYKGKLPLNMITVTTPCQDIKPNTFMIEGKLINPIVVSCLDKSEFNDWILYFKSADVPILSPPPPVYDIIYTPTQKQVTKSWIEILLYICVASKQYNINELLFSCLLQRGFSGHIVMEAQQISYGYSPDDSYLQPVDPDDQEMDYDNIWEFDPDNRMIQPLPGTSPHRTLAYFGAQGLGAMTTQQRWS
ncbi:pleckstrin homology domain-containing family N member 1-like [Sinocyclocheilus grahami]|uniref:pleckstrin homology domain-containing family N member 1-like n=1 Tax=Sinocyclocheilus grahami TaxID=75366 RepID=UPI0007AD5C04|nr:PREDICTED: pleckstrin homology domain-containing family N member 1-like [Sinocyclocheilus grahami]